MPIKRLPQLSQQTHIPPRLLVIPRVLVIHIQPIQPVILQYPHRALHKHRPFLRAHHDRVHRRGIRPPADADQDFEVAVLLLEEVYGFEVPVEVRGGLVPGVAGVVDVFVGPGVGDDDFAGGGYVGEGVEDVSVCGVMLCYVGEMQGETHVRSCVGIDWGGYFLP